MSRIPCEQRRIQMPVVDDPQAVEYTVLPAKCASPFCEREADGEHHAVPKWFTRSWWTRDWALIDSILVPVKIPLCRICHMRCTENDARVVWVGQWAWEHGDGTRVMPMPISFRYSGLSDAADATPSRSAVVDPGVIPPGPSGGDPAASLSPGTTCDKCGRKVPHPRKPSSPKSAVKSYRIPADAREEWDEMVDAAASYMGIEKEPYATYKVLLTALVILLQTPANEIGGRAS